MISLFGDSKDSVFCINQSITVTVTAVIRWRPSAHNVTVTSFALQRHTTWLWHRLPFNDTQRDCDIVCPSTTHNVTVTSSALQQRNVTVTVTAVIRSRPSARNVTMTLSALQRHTAWLWHRLPFNDTPRDYDEVCPSTTRNVTMTRSALQQHTTWLWHRLPFNNTQRDYDEVCPSTTHNVTVTLSALQQHTTWLWHRLPFINTQRDWHFCPSSSPSHNNDHDVASSQSWGLSVSVSGRSSTKWRLAQYPRAWSHCLRRQANARNMGLIDSSDYSDWWGQLEGITRRDG